MFQRDLVICCKWIIKIWVVLDLANDRISIFATCTYYLLFLFLTQGHFFSLLLWRERKGERETLMWEGNIYWVPLVCTLTRGCMDGGETHNQGMCPDWVLNPQPFSYGTVFQPTEPPQPGLYLLSLKNVSFKNRHNLCGCWDVGACSSNRCLLAI